CGLALPALDRQRAEDVGAEVVSGFLAAAAFDQLQDAEVFSALQRQAATVDGDPILDQPSQAVDPANRIQKKIISGASDQHFVEIGVRLKHLRPRHPLEATVQQDLLLFAGGAERLLVDPETRKQERL